MPPVQTYRRISIRSRLLPLLLALPAFAAEPAPVTHDFLAAEAVDFRAVIAVPPADDSIAGQADLEVARMLHANRTPEQAALARHYEQFSVFILLSDVLGTECKPENLPRTASFFKQAYAEARPVILAAKYEWNRPRPYARDPGLEPAIAKLPANTSYPSGHSFESSWEILLLSAALPEHAADWGKQARLVRWSRLYAGAHFPNDVVAGRILGEAVGRAMLQSPKTLQALAEVRSEILAHAPKSGP
jgi:acid phosphatase (class A)